LKLSFLSSDFQEIVQTSFESEPGNFAVPTSGPGKLFQGHPLPPPPKSPSLPPDSQKIPPTIIEANAAQISDVQTLRGIVYDA